MDKPYLLECKAHAGASIPLSPHIKIKSKKVKGIPTQIEVIDNYGVIKKTQIDEMFKYATTTNAKAYFIFQLYEKGKAYLVPVIDVHFAIYRAGRKSLSLEWLNEFGIPILFKPKGRSEMHFVYDLSYLYK
jgi:hypothetical protein